MNKITSAFIDNTSSFSLATHLRRKRSAQLRKMIDCTLAEKGSCQIVDLGGTKKYWDNLGWDIETFSRLKITILNIKESKEKLDHVFDFAQGDATDIRHISDNEYDICHSNSVIEHVGNWDRKKAFAKEVARISRKYFIQTPSFWFPVEPHFAVLGFHWLPKPWRVSLTFSFDLGWRKRARTLDDAIRSVEDIDILTCRMMQHLFPDAAIHRERVAFITKSFIAIRE